MLPPFPVIAEAASPLSEAMGRRGLHPADWMILACYIAGVVALGLWFSRGQRSVKDYFIGSGSMNSALIGISIFTAKMSSISYLAYPGEIIKHGPTLLVGLLSVPVAYWIVGYGLLPVLMRHRVTSAYELLEARLGLGGRLLGAGMFIVSRLIWMSLLIYLSSKALIVILNFPASAFPWIVMATGLFSIFYTSLGGLRAVVITDTAQFLLFFLGAIVTVILITFSMGGVSAWWPTEWAPHWDHQPFFSADPTVRISIVGILLMQTVWRVCAAGGDQLSVQRFMATKDAAAARRSFLINSIAGVVVFAVLAMVGFSLLGYFTAHPGAIPYSGSIATEADHLFPFFIAEFLPPGVTGFLVVAIFAAAMSSIDSGVNSITAVVQNDLLARFGLSPRNPRSSLRLTIGLAFLIGTVVVLVASFAMQHVPGNFLEMAQRTSTLLIAPLFALFMLAFLIPFANGTGALIGTLYGVCTSFAIAYSGVITGGPAISFMYIDTCSLIVSLTVGIVASRCLPQGSSRMQHGVVLAGAVLLLLTLIFWIVLP